MIRPRKMKHVTLTVLKNDINPALEYLGRREAMHFTGTKSADESEAVIRVRELLDRLHSGAEFLGIRIPSEHGPDTCMAGEAEYSLANALCDSVELLKNQESAARQGKRQVEETLHEARAFSNLNVPFSQIDHLSYMVLRVGNLDPKEQPALRESLGERAVVVSLGEGQRILAASSRKGRFALDSELKKTSFKPIAIPEGYKGIPPELLESLENKLMAANTSLDEINQKKEEARSALADNFIRLTDSFSMGLSVERLKSRLVSTASIFLLSGWIAQDSLKSIVSDLSELSNGRIAIHAYNPNEIAAVREGIQKVPVSLKHGAFVRGFEGMVFSYGAPLYGTIDPTPIVAVFFTLFFGIMFGDLGQGSVLLLLGLLTSKYGPAKLSGFKKYSTPLICVGISSMVMGLLVGSVFTNEQLLVRPTRAITALFGVPVDRILTIIPLAEQGGSIRKLFLFFAFTIGMGIVLNTLGLVINIFNCFVTKKYEAALFSKTGLSGTLFFFYALFIALRMIFGGAFQWFDSLGLIIPCFFIFFGHALWRFISGKKPVLEHGLTVFIMEGFVEILETVSSYFANTVSFLRVGAFALSHAVLSYIVFRFSEDIVHWNAGLAGSLSAFLLMVFGNLVIIVLEGLIVAIQVVRLQYYEFFSKFFSETGIEFSPFRFNKKVQE